MKFTPEQFASLLAQQERKTRGPAAGAGKARDIAHGSKRVWFAFDCLVFPGNRANGRRNVGQEIRAKKLEKAAILAAWADAGRPRPASQPVVLRFELVRPKLLSTETGAEDIGNAHARIKAMQDALCSVWGIDDNDLTVEIESTKDPRAPAPFVRVRFRCGRGSID